MINAEAMFPWRFILPVFYSQVIPQKFRWFVYIWYNEETVAFWCTIFYPLPIIKILKNKRTCYLFLLYWWTHRILFTKYATNKSNLSQNPEFTECPTRGGRPTTSISSPNHSLLIFSSEPNRNPRPFNIIFFKVSHPWK